MAQKSSLPHFEKGEKKTHPLAAVMLTCVDEIKRIWNAENPVQPPSQVWRRPTVTADVWWQIRIQHPNKPLVWKHPRMRKEESTLWVWCEFSVSWQTAPKPSALRKATTRFNAVLLLSLLQVFAKVPLWKKHSRRHLEPCFHSKQNMLLTLEPWDGAQKMTAEVWKNEGRVFPLNLRGLKTDS